MPTQQIARMTFLGLGLAAAAGIVAILSLVLPPGSTLAVLLLDLQAEGANMFTYPLTIQNFCWLLFGVGVGDVLHRKLAARREVRAVKLCLLPEDDKTILVLEDLPSIRQRVLQVGRTKGGFLCRLIDECVLYFGANRDPGQTMNLMTTLVDLEAHRVDLRYTLLRYLAWILPTLGFIGTMVGIAGSLRMINPPGGEAIDMEGVVATLSVAFN
ncbi:MAG: MotA/TolQ/ExbB proton channel family protein, partial [Myxococcales bacterium]|nr:MotA/TolQ/ExbB proton channel family protein [Myxococcales bacterium]